MPRYLFDGFVVDGDLMVVTYGDDQVLLKPKHVHVLCVLLDALGRALSKDEILNAVWPGEGASENYIYTAITEIRKHLGDEAGQRYVRTIRGYGYAFVHLDVQIVDSQVSHAVSPTQYRARATRALAVGTVLNEAGTLRRTQRIEGFKADIGQTVHSIHGISSVWTPGATLREPPKLKLLSPFPRRLNIVFDDPLVASRVHWQIVGPGPFTDADPPLDYEVSSVFDGAVLMSKREVAVAYANDLFKHDYLSWDPSLPVDSVDLTVTFQPSIPVALFPGVFLGQTEWFFHEGELARVKHGFTCAERSATFRIKRPASGFRYFIYWIFEE